MNCISCGYIHRVEGLGFHCSYLKEYIKTDDLFEKTCPAFDRGTFKMCPNCGNTGWSKGQPCPCTGL
ncbi:hypothetical protein DRN75_01815 [Nanoarchaeota archaeon]|nr:MAG: hypothetical protein DRN75_01815 [Nanoarchaeota archaeon]